MRTTATKQAGRTIDVTETSRTIDLVPAGVIDLAPPARPVLYESSDVATATVRRVAARDRAIAAYRTMRRQRITRAGLEAVADASMASGGLALANVSLHLDLGLPDGIAGIALGAALVCVGAAIAALHRGRRGGTDPAAAATPARIIVLDDPPGFAPRYELPAPEHHAA